MAAAATRNPKAPATERLIETLLLEGSRTRPLTVDREKGVIRGVKLLGEHSGNGRHYPPQKMKGWAPLYEGKKVFIDHGERPRKTRDGFGRVENVAFEEAARGLYGDIRYNKDHPMAAQIAYAAENLPDTLGMSHNADGRVRRTSGGVEVDELKEVHSVDLVTEPATTKSLSESVEGDGPPDADGDPNGDPLMELKDLPIEEVLRARPDLKTHVLKEHQAGAEATAQAARVKALEDENAKLKENQAKAARREAVDKALKEAKLPEVLLTEAFKGQCYATADDAALKPLIEDRQAIAKSIKPGATAPVREANKPRSTAQELTEENRGGGGVPAPETVDSKAFARMARR